MKEGMFRKALVCSVIFLFIISVVPSTGTVFMEKSSLPAGQDKSFDVSSSTPAYIRITNAVDSPTKLSVRGHVAYGWVAYSNFLGLGPCYFDVTKPETITKLADILIPNFLSGGTWTNDGRWLCCYYGDGQLWEVNPLNGNIYVIGGGGVNLNGLACNPVNNRLYGAGDTALYAIDMETGAQELIGPFGSDVWYMIGMAFDSSGVLYGWSLNDYLWTINTSTGDATQVGPLGIDLNYAQDGDFDRDNGDILYLAAFTLSPNYGGYLYTCDKNTGACTLVGAFPGITEIDALAIPYNWSNPIADFTWTPTLPNPGETILFNASASYDPDGYFKLYEWDWNNDGIFDENHTSPTATHSWSLNGSYPVTLKVTDDTNLIGMKTKKVRVGNQPPYPPTITGPKHSKVGIEYQYNFSLSDPDDDRMYLFVDWGDGTPIQWSGLHYSGSKTKRSHTWDQKGTYTIRAQAKDVYGAESDWGTLIVTMPVNQQISQQSLNLLLLKMMQRLLLQQ